MILSSLLLGCGALETDTPMAVVQPESEEPVSSIYATNFAELCAGNGVIFCDNFEEGINAAWKRDGGDVRILSGAVKEGEGNSLLALYTHENASSSKLLYTFTNRDSIHVRYDVRYAVDYDNTGGSHGPILGGSMSPPWGMLGTAGLKPNGNDHFVLNHEPLEVVGSGGQFGFYTYFVNMTPDGRGDYWGKVFRSQRNPRPWVVPGQWHCVEYSLSLNIPGDTTDGSARFWVDDVLHGDFTGFQWRSLADLGINTFVLDSYNHFRNGARSVITPNIVYYDNVIISTEPVGCLE